MKPQIQQVEQDQEYGQLQPREQFVKQVEDESLSARQVLTQQRELNRPEKPAPLFVP